MLLFKAPSPGLWPFHLQSNERTPANQHRRPRLSLIDSLELTPDLFPARVPDKGHQVHSRDKELNRTIDSFLTCPSIIFLLFFFSSSGFKMSPDDRSDQRVSSLRHSVVSGLVSFLSAGADRLLKVGVALDSPVRWCDNNPFSHLRNDKWGEKKQDNWSKTWKNRSTTLL